jgi:glycine cleavage system H protein
MSLPNNLKYTKEHLWIQPLGDDIYQAGITDYAQQQLGDVVFVNLPQTGSKYHANDVCGSIESVKSVSDLFCPVSGKVTEINQLLTDEPEQINDAPYDAWIFRIEIADPLEIESLLDAHTYQKLVL